MAQDLSGRVALVTGGSRGVGAAVSARLACDGASVAVNYRSDVAAAEQVVAGIVAAGGTAIAVPGAVDDPDAVRTLVATVRAELGSVDLLVSNAGVASRGRRVADTSAEEFVRLMQVHTFGPLGLISMLLPELRAAGRADIIVISSVTVDQAPANSAPYTMAKAAMELAARTLAREERSYGVRVNIVAPGLVETDMGARLVRAVHPTGGLAQLQASYPFGRICQPVDVAGVVAFLVGADGAYVTGQRVVVDGGGNEPQLV